MFLECVRIVNFRRYYGECAFKLDFNDEKNVTTFVADNNAGKSSLVNALSWCLYGDELHDEKKRSEPYCNVDIMEEAEKEENNPQAKVEVEVKFYNINDDEEKEYFTITRSLKYHKFGDAEWTPEMSDKIIFEDNLGKLSHDEDAEIKIKELIPDNMFKYFSFNGASMGNYFKYDSEDTFNLKDSIDNISQLGLIKTVQDQLKGTLSKLNTDSKNNKHDDEDDLIDKLNDKKGKLMDEKDKKNEYKSKQDDASRKIYEYEEKLKKIKATKIKKLVNDRDSYKNKRKTIDLKIKKNTADYENLVLELFPICALFEPLYNSYKIMDNSIEKNAIPNDVRKQIIKIIQDEGKCICGLDLNEHPECINDVKNKLKGETKENSLYRKEYEYIEDVLKKLRKIPEIEKLKSNIDDDNEHLKLINSKLNDISEKLLDSQEEKVNEYEKSLKIFEDLEKKYSEKFERSTIRINNLQNEIETLEKDINEISYKNAKLVNIKEKIDFCHNLINVMEDLRSGVRNQIRSKVNKKTKNQFIGIKFDEYSDVSIDNEYNVHIVENAGRIVIPGDLSDGTENLLALSFIMALHSIKGIDFPLIIDAPFEKLDRKSRIEFVNGLHDFTKDKQVIFLFTDSQYTEEVRAHMLKIILGEFKLTKISPKRTKIEPIKSS
ncbi:AAA family ATPase [Methanobrevibacter sp.]|uniref:AAA family ATPase n=1 Tax=Methanobrevibacter sp. TaxID=66852 RepID=UPI00386BC3DC